MKNGNVLLLTGLVLALLLGLSLAPVYAQDDDTAVPPAVPLTEADRLFEAQQIEEALANPPAPKPLPPFPQEEAGQTASPPPNKWESEWNGSFNTANPINVGDVISGKIGSKTDQDYFVVPAPAFASGNLLFDIDAQVNGSPLDSVLCLYDANKVLVACNDDSDLGDSLIYQNGGWGGDWDLEGKVYLHVRAYGYPNLGGSTYTYTLSVANPLLISANVDGTVDGMPFSKSDLLAWQEFNNGAEKWSMFFDASDMLIKSDLEAVGLNHGVSLVLGAGQNMWVDGVYSWVKPQDVIHTTNWPLGQFNFGSSTWGDIGLDYRGADYGLTTSGELIDALSYGGWWVSTVGRTSHVSGLKFEDEDIFNLPYGFMDFDGSTVAGLGVEDVIGAQDAYPWRLLVIAGNGTIQGHNVNQKQIFKLNYDTSAWGGIYWDGRDHGFNYPIDAIAR